MCVGYTACVHFILQLGQRLTSPLHLWALDAAAEGVPEACFIQTHRSLVDVLPSFCSVAAVLMSGFSDQVEPARMGPVAMDLCRLAIERSERARQRIAPARIIDITYDELVEDPIAAVRRIYEHFDYDLTPEFEERMVAYLVKANRGRGRRIPHRYSLEQFSLDRDEILAAFGTYHERYGLS